MSKTQTPAIQIWCDRCGLKFLAHKDQVVQQLHWVCTHCGRREAIRPDQVVDILQGSEFRPD